MRKLLALIAMLAAISAVAQTSSKASQNSREKLLGAWKLVSIEEPGPDGKLQRLSNAGVIMYTHDGHMAVQIKMPEETASSAAAPIQYSKSGYEAYFGTYTVDEKAGTVTHHVQGALVGSLVGKDLTRAYQFSGKQLILRSSRQDEHWTVVWERY
jgi:hypothetical protein